MDDENSLKSIIKHFLRGVSTNDPKTGEQIAGRFIPEKTALLKILYHRKKASENPYLDKSTIAKILFEQKTNHVDSYLKGNISQIIEYNNSGHLKLLDWDNFPNQITINMSMDSFPKTISSIESSILVHSRENDNKHQTISDFVDFGLKIILQKYEDLFSKLSDSELEKICNSIRRQKFQGSFVFKIMSKVVPQIDSMSRLVLDALMFSAYCLVLGVKSGSLDKTKVVHIIERITKLLLNSQGENGAWALGNYESLLMAKDTSMILYLLKEIQETFTSVKLDQEKISRSYNFLMSQINDLAKRKQETVELETEYLRQLGFYTAMQLVAGIQCASKLLDKEDVFSHKFVKQFFKYLSKLEKDGGYARDAKNEPDVETTSFVVNTLIGQNSFAFADEQVSSLMGKKFDSMQIIKYFHNNQKAVRDFLNKGQNLNVVTDSMSALLWCGVWPLSSQVIDILVKTCDKSKESLLKFKEIPLLEMNNNKLSVPLKLGPMYWNVMPSIHVLHQTILCLYSINQYLESPEDYWKKIEPLLEDS